jgi:hypothetical protein
MAYTVMLWLVNPGPQAHEAEAIEMLDKHRSLYPGAQGGVNEPPAATRLVYGVYGDKKDAEKALESISRLLSKKHPIRIDLNGGNVFLVPASRVHYAVMGTMVKPSQKPSRGKGKAKP